MFPLFTNLVGVIGRRGVGGVKEGKRLRWRDSNWYITLIPLVLFNTECWVMILATLYPEINGYVGIVRYGCRFCTA